MLHTPRDAVVGMFGPLGWGGRDAGGRWGGSSSRTPKGATGPSLRAPPEVAEPHSPGPTNGAFSRLQTPQQDADPGVDAYHPRENRAVARARRASDALGLGFGEAAEFGAAVGGRVRSEQGHREAGAQRRQCAGGGASWGPGGLVVRVCGRACFLWEGEIVRCLAWRFSSLAFVCPWRRFCSSGAVGRRRRNDGGGKVREPLATLVRRTRARHLLCPPPLAPPLSPCRRLRRLLCIRIARWLAWALPAMWRIVWRTALPPPRNGRGTGAGAEGGAG